MTRAPFQILLFPYTVVEDSIFFALFRTSSPANGRYWQGIAGIGEDQETPLDTAKREGHERAGIMPYEKFIGLEIPLVDLCGFQQGRDVLRPQFTFGVEVDRHKLTMANQLMEFCWKRVDLAIEMVPPGCSRTALWDLYERLKALRGSSS